MDLQLPTQEDAQNQEIFPSHNILLSFLPCRHLKSLHLEKLLPSSPLQLKMELCSMQLKQDVKPKIKATETPLPIS